MDDDRDSGGNTFDSLVVDGQVVEVRDDRDLQVAPRVGLRPKRPPKTSSLLPKFTGSFLKTVGRPLRLVDYVDLVKRQHRVWPVDLLFAGYTNKFTS